VRRLLFAFVAVTLCGLSTSLYGGVILNETFDGLTPGETITSVGSFNTIGGTNVDIVGNQNGSFFPTLCASPESGNCVDMGGTNGNPQGQLQSTTLFPAGSYFLSFDLIGSQRGISASTTVTFGNYSQLFTLGSADNSSGIIVNQPVTLSSPGNLLFVSNTAGFVGNLLDDVVVSTATSSVPEPSSLLLVGSALLAGIVSRTRTSRRSLHR
jgi:hypothetical protein